MKRKIGMRVGIGVILLFTLIDLVAGFYFYHLVIERGPKDYLVDNADLEVSADAMDEFTKGDWHQWLEQQSFETIDMTSYDGLVLKSHFLPAEHATKKTVILAHGYLGDWRDMGLYARFYHETLGYNVLMPDLRGQGESEGDYIGFGWPDRKDIVDWADLLSERLGDDSNITLHGVSMGAAAVLMASGEELPSTVRGIISDSAYTSVQDMFAYQIKRMYHLPSFPVLQTMSGVTKLRAGYSLSEASALKQVEKADVPILYIHGDADKFVPTAMSKKLYHHTKSDAKFVLMKDAGHAESFVVDQARYEREVKQFLEH